MKKHNLHTHTLYSDGRLSPQEITFEAKLRGLETIGITDHLFTRRLPSERQIKYDQIEKYNRAVRNAGEKAGIKVLVGAEIDVSRNFGIDPRELPFRKINELFDYVLVEHIGKEKFDWKYGQIISARPLRELLAVRSKFKIPVGLAHNDLQLNYQNRELAVAEVLALDDVFVEIDQSERRCSYNGRNTRSRLDFYEHFSPILIHALKQYNVGVVLGTDSHTGIKLGESSKAETFIEKNQLKCHHLIA